MPVITKISIQQKNKDRYNIFLDDKYAFSVDEEVLIKHQLKKGMDIDDFSMADISYHDDISKAYNTAIQHLSRRMRSEKEVRQHLKEKEIEDPVIQEVIHKLYKHKFLDDQEYAIAFVRTQVNTTDKGSAVIRRELREKGIADPMIEQAMLEYTFDMELSTAGQIAEKFVLKNKRDSTRIMKQKLEQLLVRKGFPLQIIQEAISEVDADKSEDEEMTALLVHAEKAHRKYANLSGFEYEQKMKQTLYRKGFSIELIERYLRERI